MNFRERLRKSWLMLLRKINMMKKPENWSILNYQDLKFEIPTALELKYWGLLTRGHFAVLRRVDESSSNKRFLIGSTITQCRKTVNRVIFFVRDYHGPWM